MKNREETESNTNNSQEARSITRQGKFIG